jgi:hypothetical protein
MATASAPKTNRGGAIASPSMESEGMRFYVPKELFILNFGLAVPCRSVTSNAHHYPCLSCDVFYSQCDRFYTDDYDRRVQKRFVTMFTGVTVAYVMVGADIVDKVIVGSASWSQLFAKHDFFHKYRYYLQVIASTGNADLQIKWCAVLPVSLGYR